MSGIDEAKAIIRSHEEFSLAQDVDGVLTNMADDVVALAPDTPLLKGKEALRPFYEGFFAMGVPRIDHEYHGAAETGDIVVLHGVARGTVTPSDGEQITLSNNFVLTLKRDEGGSFKFWRAAFAGSGE